MKKLILSLCMLAFMTSCSVTIPLQTNLSEATLLMAKNKDINVTYDLISEVPDGYITYYNVMKNGNEQSYDESYKYQSATAFGKIWSSYFQSKFNNYSKNEMKVEVVMQSLELRQKSSTSVGFTALTGNSKVTVEADASFYVKVDYRGETFEKDIKVNVSDYNESQTVRYGNNSYTSTQTNPTQQKAILLQNCLNRAVIEFENFLSSIMVAD